MPWFISNFWHIYSDLSLDWDYYTNLFYMKLKIPIDMKISNVEKSGVKR